MDNTPAKYKLQHKSGKVLLCTDVSDKCVLCQNFHVHSCSVYVLVCVWY